MPATSRWILFDESADTIVTAGTSNTISGTGTRGYVEGNSTSSGVISIVAGNSDQMQIRVNGVGSFQTITLTSGTNLDARTIANDISYKIKQLSGSQFDSTFVEFVNNKFRIHSSSLGTSSSVEVNTGPNDCLHLLGMAASQGGSPTVTQVDGTAGNNNASYNGGQVTATGTYTGQLDDMYVITIGTTQPIGNADQAQASGYAGVCTTAGWWNNSSTATYTITIDTTNGTTMNGGNGNVPTITWTASGIVDSGGPIELLYSDYYYNIGTQGLRVKFSDAPFGNGDIVKVTCTPPQYAESTNVNAAVGTAKFHWGSVRHGKSSSVYTTQTTSQAINKGVTVAWTNVGTLTANDKFTILATGPQPTSIGVTLLNYGSVTVSTYSNTKPIWFELISGATILTNCRFGLQSRGTAQHHQQGNNDTLFAFGTSGEGTPASDGTEWRTDVNGATDLSSPTDTPPSYLAAIKHNLNVVSTATASEPIGVVPGQMITDFIYNAVKLGSAETGANSSITYRMFYDFS